MGSLQHNDKDCGNENFQDKTDDADSSKNNTHEIAKGNSKRGLLERRVSPRLKNIPEDKKPYYGPDWKKQKLDASKPEDNCKKSHTGSRKHDVCDKKVEVCHSMSESLTDLVGEGDAENGHDFSSTPVEFDDTETLDLEDDAYLKWTDYRSFLADSIRQKADTKVKDTLRIFNNHFLHFVKEKNKCKEHADEGSASQEEGSGISAKGRPDLKAVTEMIKNKEVLYRELTIGHVPGIPVGYQFCSRAEMVAIGFHSHWLSGIDYVGKNSVKSKKNKGVPFPLAVAIVLSGQYEDDADYSNEVVYTGQGGNNLLGNKRQFKDQELTLGNLALKNNMEQCIPVRVIRGLKNPKSYSHKLYTYCGLYKVLDHWAETGVSGYRVFKYRLKRLLGQPKLKIEQVHFERDKASKGSARLPGLVCADISFGNEVKPIPATNLIDMPPVSPPEFQYTSTVQVTESITIPPSAPGCNCKGNCTNPLTCSCARLNGCDFPYVKQDGGRLIEPKDVVYECGPGCGCGPSCINRISQRGLKYRLEVYRTEKKGWAVRSWDYIPSGAPVVEYTGVLRRNAELDHVKENDYIFEIDCLHTMLEIGGRERRGDGSTPNQTLKKDDKVAESESEFCIDAGSFGNVARFINHSCDPNLFVQCVLSSHHDVRLARIVLFASDNIPPLQELTYDYGYALDSVTEADGTIKTLKCLCGTSECRGRMY